MPTSAAPPAILAAHAGAKVNLYLHITGRRDDGYHLVDSLVVFAEVGDRLSLEAGSDGPVSLEITGPFADALSAFDPADNLVLRAAKALATQLHKSADGLRFTLDKQLPLAGGIGGGSADAAAAMRLLCSLWQVAETAPEVMQVAASIGADLPACLLSAPVITRGIGEELAPVANFPSLPAVLVNPGTAQPTPAVFNARRDLEQPFDQQVDWLSHGWADTDQLINWLAKNTGNGLDAAARSLSPEIGTVTNALKAVPACKLARMSGSGSTCFGLFGTADAAKLAVDAIQNAHPDWWVSATTLTGSKA